MSARAPRGFRDVLPAEARRRERMCFEVGSYFEERGYGLIETPIVEELDTLRSCAHCDADNSFRFVDVDGAMLALRSDVTVPIARVVATRFGAIEPPYRLRYNADIFREQESLRGQPRSVRQLGIELIATDGAAADSEVVELAVGAARTAGIASPVVGLSHIGVFSSLVTGFLGVGERSDAILAAAHRGDFISVRTLATEATAGPASPLADALSGLTRIRGGREAIGQAWALVGSLADGGGARTIDSAAVAVEGSQRALDELAAVYDLLDARGIAGSVTVDFSVMRSFSYYTGVVFEIYAAGTGIALGGGGRYDQALASFGRDLPAAGFALELESVERALSEGAGVGVTADDSPRRLRIAIPKGLLYEGSLDLLERAGFNVAALREPDRQLRIVTEQAEFVISKPTDVAIYVASGAVDCGIGGRDTLVEADYPLLEMVDLRFGECGFVVAQPSSASPSLEERAVSQGVVRVATKYPRLAQRYFDNRSIPVEIVKLNGNIELAPLIGVADVIVDLTATGTTLRQNDLAIVEEVLASTARFVANPASARTDSRVAELASTLYDLVREG